MNTDTKNNSRQPARLSAGFGGFFILTGAILWGTTGTAQALAPAEGQPLVLGTLRIIIGGLAMLIVALRKETFLCIFQPLGAVSLAAACSAVYQVSFFSAVKITGVAAGTIIAIGSAPIFAGILGWIIHKECVNKRWIIATLLAIGGCTLLAGAGGAVQLETVGVFLALLAGASYALLAASLKGLLQHRPPLSVLGGVFTLAAVPLLPLLFFHDLNWIASVRGVSVSLHLGLITGALAYALFSTGLQVVPVAAAATITLAEPLTAGLLGIFLLGETVGTMGLLGMALLLSGLLILAIPRKTHPLRK
ncbi:MAG: EamA family transporter [Desulfobulbaceae bacterium]|uniref:EamA family transporter n=1 Tax=Candidatus Desulfatifera sulfidica TaxID=2841691 RepID=A0A8J6TCZ5_9BACT|nr:EamA family transporter [Candidatus Desulfatifera sulfidica]